MRRSRTWLLSLLLVPLLVGCGGSGETDPVLVTVGEQAITLGEMQRAFEEIVALDEGYRPDSLSARRFLQDYIAKTLMEQMAADSIPWTSRL